MRKHSLLTRLFLLLMLVPLLLLSSCAKSPEDKGKFIKGSLDVSRAGCVLLFADPRIPRDATTQEYCYRLVKGKVGVRLQALDEGPPEDPPPEDPPVVSPGDCPPAPTP